MNITRKLFLTICVITYLIPAFGQKDTLTTDGLYLNYNSPYYRDREGTRLELALEKLKNENIILPIPKDADMVRGELARQTKCIGLTYKALQQYIISEAFGLNFPEDNPIELLWTTGSVITSQWIHEDGECILFIKCSGGKPLMKNPNKSINKLPENVFGWIKDKVNVEPITLRKITEEEIEKTKKKITFWTPEKAKETFNAQYVITYPIKSRKSVYMGKFKHKQDLMMIKWGEHLTVSFLVTRKGKRNIDKYIKDVEEAFWFED